MTPRLPEKGHWQLAADAAAAPFELIKLDLRGRGTGTVRGRNLETKLLRIRLDAPDRFAARYEIRGHAGTVEGEVQRDGSLAIRFSGSFAGRFLARRVGERAVESAARDGAATALRAFACAVDRVCAPGPGVYCPV